MNSNTNLLETIQDFNLSYLILAQKIIWKDKFFAGLRLGMNKQVIDFIDSLNPEALYKLSRVNLLICELRVNDENLLKILSKESRVDGLQPIHSGLILAKKTMG